MCNLSDLFVEKGIKKVDNKGYTLTIAYKLQ